MIGVPLWEIGGPHTFASTQSVFTVPLSTLVYYDYQLPFRNSDGAATIIGGLNGEPSRVNFYHRGPYEAVPIYFGSEVVYAPVYDPGVPTVRIWTKLSADRVVTFATYSITGVYGVDWRSRDSTRIAPNAFQIAIPPAFAMASVGGRLLAGNIYDSVGATRRRGDLYFSAKNNPFRMQGVYTDDDSGSRNQYAGEQIQKIMAMGAGSQAAVYIMVWTDRETKVLGGSGALGGATANARDLSESYTISERGTNSYRTVATSEGRAFWLDQYGQIQRLIGGQVGNISRLSVGDKPKKIPASYRASAFGFFIRDIYCLSYTPEGETKNSRMIGFNTVMDAWEFDDLFPTPATGERMVSWFDSTQNGSGQRWILGASNGTFYEYDIEGADDLDSGGIEIRLTTREFSAPADMSLRIGGVWVSTTEQDAEWTFTRHYRQQTGVAVSTANSEKGRFYDGGITEVTSGFADGRGERGKAVYLDVSALVEPGTVLEHLGIELVKEASDDAEQG